MLVQVKHDHNDMNEGETVVLTLADKALLTKKGLSVAENDEEDELENVLKVGLAEIEGGGFAVKKRMVLARMSWRMC